jgi:hypothetical protein
MNTEIKEPLPTRLARVNLEDWPLIPEKTLEIFPPNFAFARRAIPLCTGPKIVVIAIDEEDSEKMSVIRDLLPDLNVHFLLAKQAEMDTHLRRRYSYKLLESGT